MRLELCIGPLVESRLRALSALYGAFNVKYRDLTFCTRLFCESPDGRSLHAFVVDDSGEVAGHYGIVPMAILVRGERRLAGKGEAFVVREDSRDATVQVGEDPAVSIGMAMPLYLYPFAMDQGTELVHMMAPADVAPLHRMAGCRSLAFEITRRGVLLRPELAASRSEAPLAGGVVDLLARAYAGSTLALARLVLTSSGGAGAWTARPPGRGQFERLQDILPRPTGWGLDLDLASLAWQASFSRFEWLERPGQDAFALICTHAGVGSSTEIVHLHSARAGVGALRALLAASLLAASRSGSTSLAFSNHVVAPDARADLESAARSLGLRVRPRPPGMLVYARDSYYRDPAHLQFTPFFHAAF